MFCEKILRKWSIVKEMSYENSCFPFVLCDTINMISTGDDDHVIQCLEGSVIGQPGGGGARDP